MLSAQGLYSFKKIATFDTITNKTLANAFIDKNGFLFIQTNKSILVFDGASIDEYWLPNKGKINDIFYNLHDSSITFYNGKTWILENEKIKVANYQLPSNLLFFGGMYLKKSNEAKDLITVDSKEYDPVIGSFNKQGEYYRFSPNRDTIFYSNPKVKKIIIPKFTDPAPFILGLDTIALVVYIRKKILEVYHEGELIDLRDICTENLKKLLFKLNRNNGYNQGFIFNQYLEIYLFTDGNLYKIEKKEDKYDATLLYNGFSIVPSFIVPLPNGDLFTYTHSEGVGYLHRNPFNIIRRSSKDAGHHDESRCVFMNEEDVILDYHWVYLQTPKFRQTVYRADKGSTFITQSNGFYFYCTRKSKYNYRLVKESILGKSAYVLPTSFENVIECMIEDKSRNRFLLNTRTDLYELKKDTINHICNLRGNGQVEIIFLKSDSVLLLGSDLNLVELNIKTQARKILLSDVDIRDIKSYRNRIWLFAYGQGLYVLEKDKLTKVPIDNRGYLLYAHSFFLHRDSSIWITTNNGILRVSSPEIPFLSDNTEGRVHYTIYDKNSGINTELNGAGYPSWSRDSKNNYYIACADGILVFNPDSIRNNSSRKLISIKSCKINNEEIFIKDTIVINNITDKIELSIRSPRYNSENIALLYRIDGSAWRGLNNDKILISNLSLGDHKLEISDDSTGVRVNTLTLIIDRKRYWYQYTLIQLVITLFLVGLVFYIGYFKFYLVLRNKIQEQKRQKIINKILLHDIKSPINYLEQILTNLNKNNIDTDIANKELYTVIRKTTTDISSITSTLLNWIKATNNRGAAKSNLRDEINKSTNYYSLIFKKKNIIVKNSISDVWISINPVMFHIILNNIFDNVSKHGEPGLLEIERIESCKHKNTVCLRISNTGLIAPIKLNKIRKVLAGITQDIVEDSNTLGIIIISDLCKLQSYSIDISTDVDQNKTIIDLHSIKKAD